MASRKKPLTQRQRSAIPKLRKLKKRGLFKGRVRRPSRYGIKQTGVFGNVLADRAAVVKVPRSKLKDYKGAFTVRAGRVIIPRAKGEKVFFNPKSAQVESVRRESGKKIRSQYRPVDMNQLDTLPLGPGLFYVLPLGSHFHYRAKTLGDIKKFVFEYEAKYRRSYKNWQRYVRIEEIDDSDSAEE